jgi:predicted phosphodiesterase
MMLTVRHLKNCLGLAVALLMAGAGAARAADEFRFVLLGDRTGEAVTGVYEQLWKQIAGENPRFVITTGDSIQGLNDATAESEWREFLKILGPYAKIPFYTAAGNHDVWSAASEQLYTRFTKRPLRYSFDSAQLHVTVLDNSRSDEMPKEDLAFWAADLKAHAGRPLKMMVSHRPSWLINIAMRNSDYALHKLAKQYGVQYVIAGHVHQMLHLELDGVTYLSLPSAGGHLRLSGAYDDGWFFGYTLVTVRGNQVEMQVKEAAAPHGEGRVSKISDWGMNGLMNKPAGAASSGK